jgi:hypothetical protein
MSRTVVTVVLAAVGGLVLGGAGVIVGALLAGSFATDFQLGDARGYEATGQLGGPLGLAAGVLLGAVVGQRAPRGRSRS